jgi:hypothetical protein
LSSSYYHQYAAHRYFAALKEKKIIRGVVIRYDGSHMQPDPYIEGADASPSPSLYES